MEPVPPVTNRDLYERIDTLEEKMDALMHKMDQATGAWTFIKILCSVAVGCAVVWNSLTTYFHH